MSVPRIQKRSERYISYKVSETSDGDCKITVNYFIDNGNPIRDVDLQRVKYITCSKQDLNVQIADIKNIIEQTKWRMIRSLHSLGASELNIETFLKQKMR